MYSKEPTQKLTMVLEYHVITTRYEFKPEGAYLHVLRCIFTAVNFFTTSEFQTDQLQIR